MRDETRQCPKCKGEMKAGFIMPAAGGVVKWHSGAFVQGWFKLHGSENVEYELRVYRCGACGFIECYAR